jgi:hypothetical protein
MKGCVTVGLIMRSGEFILGSPELSMPRSAIPALILRTQSLFLSETVKDVRIVTDIELWMIVDENLSDIQIVLNMSQAGPFKCVLELSCYDVEAGQHSFMFYAVDPFLARISPPESYSVTVVNASELSGVIPIWFCAGVPFNFEIYGRTSEGFVMSSTSHGLGYATRLQIERQLYENSCPYEGALTYKGVTLTTHLTWLGEYAILIAFKVVNHNSATTLVDIECDSDIAPDGERASICRDLGGSRGFFFRGGDEYGFTLIGRNYPLVRNVSAYWFGSYNEYSASPSVYWKQVAIGKKYDDLDAGCAWS